MALTILQTVGLIGLGVGGTALGVVAVRKARSNAKLREKRQGALPAPTPSCPEGLTPHMVEGEWHCLPIAAPQECLEGIFFEDRQPLPPSIAGLLGENAIKTADQFYGFHLSPEAMEEAYTVFAAELPDHDEPEEVYYRVLADIMPCTWPLWGDGQPAPGFSASGDSALAGWPIDWNYYLDPPEGVTERMEKGARSLMDLWVVAVSQQMDQYLPADVDPVSLVNEPDRDACARDEVINMRLPGSPTAAGVIIGALTMAGYDVQTQNVDQIMAQLEDERPLLLAYLESDWRISAEMQERMWEILLAVEGFPRPVLNMVSNAQSHGDAGPCSWEEKDRYTINMASFWYAARRLAAIAELSGMGLPTFISRLDEG